MRPRDHEPSPFSPGYGRKPLVFGGHERIVDELTRVFDTLDFGENQSVLVSGLRGAGKTSMLSVLQDAARERGWLVIDDDASRGLMERVMGSTIPALVNTLDPDGQTRLTGLNVWQLGATWERVTASRGITPLLRNDLIALSNSLDGAGILITIDEVASGKVRLRDLARFALEVQHALTAGANIMIVFAGIKVDLDELLKQEHATFLRRSRILDFRRLSPLATKHVLQHTIELSGRTIEVDALERLTAISQGYPYLIQLAGDYAWRHSPGVEEISTEDAEYALERAIRAVQQRVISRVYDDLSDRDKDFLRAMAKDEGRTKISDIKQRMEAYDQYVQVYKKRLIDSGYVQSAGHGYVEFSLPYLDRYIKSLIADDDDPGPTGTDPWSDYPAPRV